MAAPEWLIAAVREASPSPHVNDVDAIALIADRSYRHVPDDVLRARGAQTCIADLVAMTRLAAVREPGTALVEVESEGHRTLVRIVTDDMPFLVDSASAALAGLGRAIRLVIHPQLIVQRDSAGALQSILDSEISDAREPGAIAESWMCIELDPDPIARDAAEIRQALIAVLADVRAAVDDWTAMRTTLGRLADSLTDHEDSEAAALLRWLADGHFILTGYRLYRSTDDAADSRTAGEGMNAVAGTGLGVLRDGVDASAIFAGMQADLLSPPLRSRRLVLAKASARSTVHRDAILDCFMVQLHDAAGRVEQHRFVGLLTSAAHSAAVVDVPILRSRFQSVLTSLSLAPGSHSARDLQQFLQTYPRDELLQTRTEALLDISRSAVHLQERRQPALFTRRDDFGRFVSVLVYLPRDRYTTQVRERVADLLKAAFGGLSLDYTALVGEAPLARLHFIVHLSPEASTEPTVDMAALLNRLGRIVRTWEDELVEALVANLGAAEARRLLPAYRDAFPAGYRESHDPAAGARDVAVIEGLRSAATDALDLRLESDGDSDHARFTVTRIGPAMSLARVLPMLELMGVEVVQESPYEVSPRGGPRAFVLEFSLVLPAGYVPDDLAERFTAAFAATWSGRCEVDGFNTLITAAGLRWQEVRIIRALSRYVRQLGAPQGIDSMQRALIAQPQLARLLVQLFHVRCDPDVADDSRESRQEELNRALEAALASVPSLDQDRIIRALQSVVNATLRTNAYLPGAREGGALAMKLQSPRIIGMPAPAPAVEIWVSSPRMEGVHLRRGPVARGGIRWSDRREDFRTEILGLVKAQEVKNTVIIPVGAKGGFVPLQPVDPSVDRAGWAVQGRETYAEFITALLSITDNIHDGAVIPPAGIVLHDGPDPYLVVAADKGTASFSDIANEIAAAHDFWLGDAFASGGSHGYDHKAMGITARGAWESVKRHFLELDIDPATQPFTVVGIGDMSGDVFGNGMLLSNQIRLIAAFDHRHVFIDPNPDPAISYAERQRLFELPQSSWADYDRNLLSPGGVVVERSAKSITLSAQACDALGIDETDATGTPDQIVQVILRAPAQLLWNGGIGTYVKSSVQTNAEVADRANDAVRISGDELRCLVVGEGGNLGFTQLGRVEAAQHSVRLNTDAIDNSAGVDTSDHEVNIKILLDGRVRAGELTEDSRNELLESMTNDVADSVLRDNYRQNVVLANARAGADRMISVHQRLMHELSRTVGLDRALEGLPDDEELAIRKGAGRGLTSPELAVLLAYTKIGVTAALVDSDLARDPWFESALLGYFPAQVRDAYPEAIRAHPLAERIIATVTANRLVNIGGITFVFRAMEETGATTVDVVRAATAAMAVFSIEEKWNAINDLDGQVPTQAQTRLHLELRRLLDRGTRWFLQTRGGSIDIAEQVSLLAPIVGAFTDTLEASLRGGERMRLARLTDAMAEGGVPRGLAAQVAVSMDSFSLLDIAELVRRTSEPVDRVIDLYFAISERYDVDATLLRITSLPRGDRWSALARQALRSDLYAVVAALTLRVLRSTDAEASPDSRIDAWEAVHQAGIARAKATLAEVSNQEDVNLATLSVVLRVLRTLVVQGATSAAQGAS